MIWDGIPKSYQQYLHESGLDPMLSEKKSVFLSSWKKQHIKDEVHFKIKKKRKYYQWLVWEMSICQIVLFLSGMSHIFQLTGQLPVCAVLPVNLISLQSVYQSSFNTLLLKGCYILFFSVKQTIQQTSAQLKELQEECLSLQGQLLLKVRFIYWH